MTQPLPANTNTGCMTKLPEPPPYRQNMMVPHVQAVGPRPWVPGEAPTSNSTSLPPTLSHLSMLLPPSQHRLMVPDTAVLPGTENHQFSRCWGLPGNPTHGQSTKQHLVAAMARKTTLHAPLGCVVVQGAADNGNIRCLAASPYLGPSKGASAQLNGSLR